MLRKRIIAAAALLPLLLSLFACARPQEEQAYPIHTEEQAAYLADTYDTIRAYTDGTEEKSKPLSVIIKLDGSDGRDVRVSEYEDLRDAVTYYAASGRLELKNLKIGTRYYYDDGKTVRSFVTDAAAPRNLDVDGVTNVRDCGGWVNADGKTLRQGMIFRCGRLSEVDGQLRITADGQKTFLEDLGIKTELDLRNELNAEAAAIPPLPGTNYVWCPMTSEGRFYYTNEEIIPEIFAVFGDEANYPIIFHCAIGTDRTGFIAFLIGAVCGVSREDLAYDYLFSCFGEIGDTRTYSQVKTDYVNPIREYTDGTLAESAEKWLLDKGVKQSDIDTLRRMMLGE